MRGARAVILCLLTVALAGCMRTSGPVATVQPQGDLDSMAYGEPSNSPPPAVAASFGDGAIAALRASFAGPRPVYAAAPVAYAKRRCPSDTTGRTGSMPATGCGSWSTARKVSPIPTRSMPAARSPCRLIGSVPARGRTPAGLASEITAKLRNGFIREPSVAVEIEAYRPFFILGEVAAPGQYPYVPNMSVESAVAIAGGFSPRARRDSVTLTHSDASGPTRMVVPLGTALSPGDTIIVGERWF